MEQNYELEEDYAPRILWGRLAFFLLALVLAFSLGRCTKSSGVDQDTFAAEQQKVVELQSENTVLQAQVDAAATQGNNQGQGNGNSGNDDGGAGEQSEAPATEEPVAGEGTTYTVQPNDTLTTIAQEFYGEQSKYDLIVDANNLTDDTPLRVGQELIIPEEP
jgi:nucleoid-associated protein YgaU